MSVDKGVKPRGMTRTVEDLVSELRLYSTDPLTPLLREAADAIVRLEWERRNAVRWANESVASVQDALFPCRDALEQIVDRLGANEADDGLKPIWRAAFDALAKARGDTPPTSGGER